MKLTVRIFGSWPSVPDAAADEYRCEHRVESTTPKMYAAIFKALQSAMSHREQAIVGQWRVSPTKADLIEVITDSTNPTEWHELIAQLRQAVARAKKSAEGPPAATKE